ncbi:hypothetical protein NQ314_019866 [Rhamnusium bicolor]|uniref:Uncharacterized protein n=1 Tax=Rhamnusium bicolor TaxID=1586634 RepID=A0AAV8WNA5_9CUCU|nr:hypothetical protein NQ314_019866 [Rhamnusium bicolor]
MTSKNLVGAATRYIAGRNAVQTVYWRSQNPNNPASQSRMLKVSKTFNFGKSEQSSAPPYHLQQQQKLKIN